MMNPELKERHPDLEALIQQLQRQFDRTYDFSQREDQATFAEGMRELGRHCALNSVRGRISIGVGAGGIVSVTANVSPA